jgi:hypothetical protein
MKTILALGGGDRTKLGLELAKQYPDSHLVISSSADLEQVLASGLNPEKYTLDYTAWDTVTNVVNTKPLIDKYQPDEIFLVTDGFHMRRSMIIASLIYYGSGITITASPCSPVDHQEPAQLILFDAFRAAISRFTGNTIYTQQVYNDRIGIYYNDYYSARSYGLPYGPQKP